MNKLLDACMGIHIPSHSRTDACMMRPGIDQNMSCAMGAFV